MIVDFIVVTALFGIGILLVNILVGVLNKGKQKSLIFLTIGELLVLGVFLYAALPSKNLSSLLWYNFTLGGITAQTIDGEYGLLNLTGVH